MFSRWRLKSPLNFLVVISEMHKTYEDIRNRYDLPTALIANVYRIRKVCRANYLRMVLSEQVEIHQREIQSFLLLTELHGFTVMGK